MRTSERIEVFEKLFDDLTRTSSRNKKETIVKDFEQHYPQLKEDWITILETLDNKHPIGWTFTTYTKHHGLVPPDYTIKQIIMYLADIQNMTGLSLVAQLNTEEYIGQYIGRFIEPIVNRTLRLGIGKSLLDKKIYTPMLAKKYEGTSLRESVYVTEKLDGNRCIAYYDDDRQKWCYKSRSGKPMNVDFDMSALPKEFIYDGEVLSRPQTLASITRTTCTYMCLSEKTEADLRLGAQLSFNRTSGLINQKGGKKDLVYNIFDVISKDSYKERRRFLDTLSHIPTGNTRIVPVLYQGTDVMTMNVLLDKMCAAGGEGIMLNLASSPYENKRSSALLKYKQVQCIDMHVFNYCLGTGKYENVVGSLSCEAVSEDGKEIICDVGSGLSDLQREMWYRDPALIIGKIIEVAYHEITQAESARYYSLRFPRFKRVRPDKDTTSTY